MRKIVLLSTFVFGFASVFAQNEESNGYQKKEYDDSQNMEVVTTREASYPEGEQALFKYVFDNVNYSEESKIVKAEGNVMVSFNVNPDSTVSNAFVLSPVGYGIDEEVVRLLKGMKFLPAVRNEMLVKMNLVYTFPVRAH